MSSPLRLCLRVALGALVLTAFDAALASDASAQWERPARVTDLDGTVVQGIPEGPGTFYVVNRAAQEYRAPDVRPSFVPRIVDSVAREPF
ncbi:MAG: hypothetical protein IPG17_32360 [Sandaracinaceae bacterium]|jgi:hypothetical protein|nr:hypothetical protein [Sandaracinaceae bacterium]MBK6808470.1 hypothetical protein [Sandaracinaceae bacterium]MBK7154379.1 hypothetical protein [Sandaracinaceae bacterium]MBK7774757.1 hypothetical protein [Sandaracinaceae bacterium]MBK8411771.1 hypothetical protein [Sandaracinaceae bacterium]